MGADTRAWREERESADQPAGRLGCVTYDQGPRTSRRNRDWMKQGGRERESTRSIGCSPGVRRWKRRCSRRSTASTEIQAEIDRAAADRAELGFQPAGLATAQEAQRQATEAERAAISRQHLAQGGVNDAERFCKSSNGKRLA